LPQLDSEKVLVKIRELKTRVHLAIGEEIDLASLHKETLMLCEILFSRKSEYKSIDQYIAPSNFILLPSKEKKGKLVQIPIKEELEERRKALLINIIRILEKAEKKYSLKKELEKKQDLVVKNEIKNLKTEVANLKLKIK